jgi:tetratricopeptide (TPR) repeat protein
LSQARGLLAEFDFDGAEKILIQIVNNQDLNVRQSATASYGLGEIAEEHVKWQDALKHYKRAFGQDATLEHQQAYARLCWRMGRWDEAFPLRKDILEKVGAESGKEGLEYATALNNLATIYENTGRYVEAEPLYEEALSIHRRVLGADYPATGDSLNNLALLYLAQERFGEAAPLLEEAISIHRLVLGPDHPGTAITLNNLAGFHLEQGQYAEAAPLFNEAVEIMERVLGAEHPNTKIMRENYEVLLAEMKEEGR